MQGATGGLLGVELDSRPRVSERTPTACDEALWKLHSEPHTGSGLRVRVPLSKLGYIFWVNYIGQINWPNAVELTTGRGGHPRAALHIAPERPG